MSEFWDDELDCVNETASYSTSCNTGNWREQSYEKPQQRYSSQGTEWQADSKHNSSKSNAGNWRERSSNETYQQHTSSQGTEWQAGSKKSYNEHKTSREFKSQTRHNYENSSEILIDRSYVGKVIGRGGANIQELQRESGAHIKVSRDTSGSEKIPIYIDGSDEAQEKAKTLIEELIYGAANLSVENQSYVSDQNSSSYSQSSRNQSYSYNQNSSACSKAPILIDWDNLHKQSEEDLKKKLAALPPIIKNFYKEDPAVASMTPKEVEAFRVHNNSISVMKVDPGDDRKIPNPVTSFYQAFQHYPELLEELKKQGFSSPSPIQCQAWPIIMSGYDLIGIAQTGTGKTIAFLFPALIHLVGQVTPRNQRAGPSVLVLAPTRELAQQIEIEAKKYTYQGIKSICIYGGGSRREQINNVASGVDIVIATPGRLNDLVMSNVINVTGVTYLVLDEADRMLDLGFEPQIRKIVLDVRPDRQTIMTSATWTSEVQGLAARYQTKPLKVNVGAFDLAAVHTVTQEIIFGEDDYDERRQLLDDFILSMGPDDKAIVFVERKCIADDISSDLIIRGTIVQSIHGDREQYDREQALDDLKTGEVKILIATDVASRGLDIKDITLIFNLYFPRNIEEYVHRVGRTGRAGKTGKAISVFTRKDWMHAEGLIKILEEANQFVPDELYEMAERYRAWKKKKTAEDMAAGGRRGRNRYNRY